MIQQFFRGLQTPRGQLTMATLGVIDVLMLLHLGAPLFACLLSALVGGLVYNAAMLMWLNEQAEKHKTLRDKDLGKGPYL